MLPIIILSKLLTFAMSNSRNDSRYAHGLRASRRVSPQLVSARLGVAPASRSGERKVNAAPKWIGATTKNGVIHTFRDCNI